MVLCPQVLTSSCYEFLLVDLDGALGAVGGGGPFQSGGNIPGQQFQDEQQEQEILGAGQYPLDRGQYPLVDRGNKNY